MSPNFLVWNFGEANRPKLCRNCEVLENFRTRKLGEIIAFYAVIFALALHKILKVRCKICQNTGFSMTCIFPYKDTISHSVLIRENAGQRKPAFGTFYTVVYLVVQ